MPDLALTVLDDLAVLDARGADVLPFLNGQLSQDLSLLPEKRALLAGLHNPMGRVLALIHTLYLDDSHVLLVVPQELADTVRAHLQRFVFRARARIEEASAAWRVYGLVGSDAEAASSTRLHMSLDDSGIRQLVVAPRSEPLPQSERAPVGDWRAEQIAAGLAHITRATSGVWVAQMLNLDLIGAVSFEKGCYTGQEVIARAHFRGQVKRRMQRFLTESEAPLAPGKMVRINDGRQAQVVLAAANGYGGQEFLAVARFDAVASNASDELSSDVVTIHADSLPLPYSFPE